MKTEYLIQIDSNKKIATTEKAFNNLLMSNEKICITGNKITFSNYDFSYILKKEETGDVNFLYYHMIVESEEKDLNKNLKINNAYRELLRHIKSILYSQTKRVEVLWDDISFLCSQQAYPLIYEIENLMRKLFTKFMHINIGSSWEKDSVPKIIEDKPLRDSGRNKSFATGLLYNLDFKELSSFLFKTYAKKNNIRDVEKTMNDRRMVSFNIIEDYVKRSNWERYFSEVVNMDAEPLEKKLDILYLLRCKVAHNNTLTVNDLEQIKQLTSELKNAFSAVIEQLDAVTIEEESKRVISENVVVEKSQEIEFFLDEYEGLTQQIEFLVSDEKFKFKSSDLSILNRKLGFPKRIVDRIINLKQFRNSLAHSVFESVDDREVKKYNKILFEVDNFLDYFYEVNTSEPKVTIEKYPTVKCCKCLSFFSLDDIRLEFYSSEEGGMGDRSVYGTDIEGKCLNCENDFSFEMEVVEYPSLVIAGISHRENGIEIVDDPVVECI